MEDLRGLDEADVRASVAHMDMTPMQLNKLMKRLGELEVLQQQQLLDHVARLVAQPDAARAAAGAAAPAPDLAPVPVPAPAPAPAPALLLSQQQQQVHIAPPSPPFQQPTPRTHPPPPSGAVVC